MTFADLVELYSTYKAKHGVETFKHMSALLKEAKIIHHLDWQKKPTKSNDHEQSWKAFKGKNLEKLIVHILNDEVEALGLKIIDGNSLERTGDKRLGEVLSQVKHNLLIEFRKEEDSFGFHLPDVDIVIYHPKTAKVIAVISSKVTLRERIAQTGYWKIKLSEMPLTKDVKVFFITPDEDKTFATGGKDSKKGRAIVEIDSDGSYLMTEEKFSESTKVKSFDRFIVDLKYLTQSTK